MEQDLVNGPVGSVGSYDVSFKGGKLILVGSAELPPGESVSLSISVDANKVLDALAAAIPGKIDDAVIGLIKMALAV